MEDQVLFNAVTVAIVSGLISFFVAIWTAKFKLREIKEQYIKSLVTNSVQSRYDIYPPAIEKTQSLRALTFNEEDFETQEWHLNTIFKHLKEWHNKRGASYLTTKSEKAYRDLMGCLKQYCDQEMDTREPSIAELVEIRGHADTFIDELKKDLLPSLDSIKLNERNN